MRITAVEEYGLRCLLDLARRGPGEQLSIAEIAAIEGLSVPYASKLLSILRKTDLVVAERGRGGGFAIARTPDKITLLEVLTSLGGTMINPDHCKKYTGQLGECVHEGDCTVHAVFGELAQYITNYLSVTTLQDLIDWPKKKSESDSVIYTETFTVCDTGVSEDEQEPGMMKKI